MFRTIRKLISAGIFVVLTGLLIALAVFAPNFWFSFYPGISAKVLHAISSVTGLLPFSLWEILLGLLIAGMVAYLITCIKRHHFLCWLATLAELVAFLVFLFVALWGLNHFGPSLAEQLDMNVTEYSQSELEQAAAYYTQMASQYSTQVSRDSDGNVILSDFSTLSSQAREGYLAISDTYPLFSEPAPRVKRLLTGKGFSYMGLTGIYIAFTAEPCVNADSFGVDLPFTMCHELAHGMTVAAEEDANYCAFLACENHSSPEFRYSGYYSAFVYCYNALYRADPSAATALWGMASDELAKDCGRANRHYEQYDGSVQEAAQKVNDAYLKAFSEEEGVQSYGAVVDYLIAHYESLKKAN